MFVNLVILTVTIQCVLSGYTRYQWNYNWQPTPWNNRIHRNVQQGVYISNLNHNGQYSQLPHMYNNQITVQTGFVGTGTMNTHTNPTNWNFHTNQQPSVHLTWPNLVYHTNQNFQHMQFANRPQHYNEGMTNGYNNFHHMQIPDNQQHHTQNINGLVVDNLNGKFENFIIPDLNHAPPTVSFAPSVQPPHNQGGASVHGHPSSAWPQPRPGNPMHAPVTNAPVTNVPQVTAASPAPVTITTSTEKQEENENSNDMVYDIDVRFGSR